MKHSDTLSQSIPDAPIIQAARELVEHYGKDAAGEAAARAVGLSRDGRWPEHDLAMRVLTEVEAILALR